MKKIMIAVLLIQVFSFNALAQQTLQFEHKVRKQGDQQRMPNHLRATIAIARVNDLNRPAESSFDDKGKKSFSIEEDGDKKVSIYSSRKIELGFGQRTREVLSYYLSKTPNFQLIERENINSLLREWDFSESKYVKKSDQLQAGIEIPDLIATGFLSYTPLCDETNDLEEDAWGASDDADEEDGFFNGRSNEDEMERRRQINAKAMPFSSRYAKKKDKSNFYFLMRVYETRNSRVKFIACGEGKTVKSAIKHAVSEFSRN
ncbi:MAG: hypothetical protein GQ475_05680 [Methylococcaceae bacterium]|nr:hypothetical protein [Methylococcaceae bacterium]